jgi:hypothetical protein
VLNELFLWQRNIIPNGDGSITFPNNQIQTPSKYIISIVGFEKNMLSMRAFLQSVGIQMFVVYDHRRYRSNDGQKFCSIGASSIADANKKNLYARFLEDDTSDPSLDPIGTE